MRTSLSLSLLVTATVAFGGRGCRRVPTQSRAPEPASSAAHGAAAAGVASALDTPPAVPSTPTSPMLEHQRGDREAKVVDLGVWMQERGVKVGEVHPPCWQIQAGEPLGPALICHREGKERLTATIHVVLGQKLVPAWEGIVYTYANWTHTTLSIEDGGATLVVADPPDHDCVRAAISLSEKMYPGLGADQLYENIVTACRQRGKYRFDGRRYVRATTP